MMGKYRLASHLIDSQSEDERDVWEEGEMIEQQKKMLFLFSEKRNLEGIGDDQRCV